MHTDKSYTDIVRIRLSAMETIYESLFDYTVQLGLLVGVGELLMLYDVVERSDTNQSNAWHGTKLTSPSHAERMDGVEGRWLRGTASRVMS